MFAIASNTKAFTAAALQMLAEDGKLDMDDRVIDHLPWFRMSDPYITREMRIRDLLAHRSGLGLGAGDLLYWPGTDYSTEEVARRLRDVPIDGGFRAQYAYDNILFGVAQLVIEAASGQSYETFLRDHILQPLQMDETRFNSDFLKPGWIPACTTWPSGCRCNSTRARSTAVTSGCSAKRASATCGR